ncbi:ABC transporter substrate-binding protein [Marinomonas agarivorans]|nr:ABC transporter substrate-binding protein [Marinomonas agarivorans]
MTQVVNYGLVLLSLLKQKSKQRLLFLGLLTSFSVAGEPVVFGHIDAPSSLRIYSSFDLVIFAPLLERFVQRNPELNILYEDINTAELYDRVIREKADPIASIVVSSAMDLQIKLVNDGLAQTHISSYTEALPNSEKWRNQIFSFSLEPVVMVINNMLFPDAALPQDRSQLLQSIRRSGDVFNGKIGTYDIRRSGAGYLFASQDARQADTTWGRLLEAFGSHQVKTYCCTSDIIHDLLAGDLIVGYNLVGAYAYEQVSNNPQLTMIMPSDYTLLLRRTALIPKNAPNPANARRFLDFLLSDEGQNALRNPALLSPFAFDKSKQTIIDETNHPIRLIELDQQLLVGRDLAKYTRFINIWEEALELLPDTAE